VPEGEDKCRLTAATRSRRLCGRLGKSHISQYAYMTTQDDPLIGELRTFLGSYAEHDPDCPAFAATGSDVLDPANCICGLTLRQEELIAKLRRRLVD
jgi:hypothetical protein